MATSARKHTVPAGGETPKREVINDALASVNDIVPVANTTERAQLVADLVADGAGPTTARPLYVYRGDAPSLSTIEKTTDGTNWVSLAEQGTPAALSGYFAGWANYGDAQFGAPTLSQVGHRVTLMPGLVGRTAAASVTADTEFGLCPAGTVPVGQRPSVIRMGYSLLISGSNEVGITLRVKPDGSIMYVALAAISLGTNNTNFMQVNPVMWDV